MPSFFFALIYFFYGLAFFCMGLLTLLEMGRCTNPRLQHALYYLAAFGLLHGMHEWHELFEGLQVLPAAFQSFALRESFQQGLLAFSFLSLATFGVMLISVSDQSRRLGLLVPLLLAFIWSIGVLVMRGKYPYPDIWPALEAWTRYTLAMPSSVLACIGLIFQQREFRRTGLSRFGQDALWAAVAFAWYGLIGQFFAQPSTLPPSHLINSELFQKLFGFPIQLLRGGAGFFIAIFVVRFLRSFEVETKRKIAELQQARLEEAHRREQVYGELLRRVVSAQEAERQRIARELHDETGQALTAIGLGLRGVSTMLRQDIDRSAHNLRSLESLAASSLVELQRLISDLRPSHLDDLGLPAALRWYAAEVQNRAGLNISIELLGEVRELPAEMKTALFRVAQEALTNVVKHAGAGCAVVRLIYRSDAVLLEVEDDGHGFDPRIMKSAVRPSWGLLGMEERASLLGGHFTLWSQVGRGTRIQVVIPYHQVFEVKDGHTISIGG